LQRHNGVGSSRHSPLNGHLRNVWISSELPPAASPGATHRCRSIVSAFDLVPCLLHLSNWTCLVLLALFLDDNNPFGSRKRGGEYKEPSLACVVARSNDDT